jgi:dihydrodipicolinate synthase/N-acetylneuraminate lyase
MVMLTPPYHGATIRPDEPEGFDFFRAEADAIDIPTMVQDAPVSGVTLSAAFLARLARNIEPVQYVKIEAPTRPPSCASWSAWPARPWPVRSMARRASRWSPDLDAGATGTMPSALQPDLLCVVVQHHRAGDRQQVLAGYERSLPLILCENRQCGLQAAKVLLQEGGTIACDRTRPPAPPPHPATRAGAARAGAARRSAHPPLGALKPTCA